MAKNNCCKDLKNLRFLTTPNTNLRNGKYSDYSQVYCLVCGWHTKTKSSNYIGLKIITDFEYYPFYHDTSDLSTGQLLRYQIGELAKKKNLISLLKKYSDSIIEFDFIFDGIEYNFYLDFYSLSSVKDANKKRVKRVFLTKRNENGEWKAINSFSGLSFFKNQLEKIYKKKDE